MDKAMTLQFSAQGVLRQRLLVVGAVSLPCLLLGLRHPITGADSLGRGLGPEAKKLEGGAPLPAFVIEGAPPNDCHELCVPR